MGNIVRTIAASDQTEIHEKGAFIRVVDAPAKIIIMVNGEEFEIKQGDSLKFSISFDRFIIKNPEVSAQTIDLVVSSAEMKSSRAEGTIELEIADTLTGAAEISIDASAQNFAANVARKKIYLSAPLTNSGKIWIGAVAVNNGIPLFPGDTLPLAVTAQINFIGTVGDKLNILEVTE